MCIRDRFDTLADMLFESLTVVIVAAAVLVLLGVYCVCMMFRRYKGKRGFVVQRTEGGELSISIKAIENLVQKCIDKHEELHVMSTGLENSRDGLVIKLRIGLASGCLLYTSIICTPIFSLWAVGTFLPT